MPPRQGLLILLLLLAGCAAPAVTREPDENDEDPRLEHADVPHVVVEEAFVSKSSVADNIDSPASWHGPAGEHWVLATAKEGDRLMVYDGETGTLLATHGERGDRDGQFRRANGIFVIDDLAFVVERDNRRVQVLRLPAFRSLGSFAQGDLVQPYGLWVRTLDDEYDVLVSDAYMAGVDAAGDDIAPPLSQLDRRVRRYRVAVAGDAVQAQLIQSIGDTTQEGAIRIPESLWGDAAHDRLLIAEEDAALGTAVREYDMQGKYRGRTVGLGLFKAQAEGIALWSCPDGSGYWLMTDQFEDRSLFHVFDRKTLSHLGAFAGAKVANTDGVWLEQRGSTRFPDGVFYAVHDDQALGAFDWRAVARALGIRSSCSG